MRLNGAKARTATLRLLQQLPADRTLVPVQVLGELFAVLVRKARRSRPLAARAALSWGDAFPLIETSNDVMLIVTDLAVTHQLGDLGCRGDGGGGRCRLPPVALRGPSGWVLVAWRHRREPVRRYPATARGAARGFAVLT